MALTRSDAMGFWLCRLASVDLGRPEDCFVPKQLGTLTILGLLRPYLHCWSADVHSCSCSCVAVVTQLDTHRVAHELSCGRRPLRDLLWTPPPQIMKVNG